LKLAERAGQGKANPVASGIGALALPVAGGIGGVIVGATTMAIAGATGNPVVGALLGAGMAIATETIRHEAA